MIEEAKALYTPDMESLALKSPLGVLTLFEQDGAIVALDWGQGADAPTKSKSKTLNAAAKALTAYFKTGRLDVGAIELAPHGTEFQKRVWRAMSKIKDGQTKTYQQLAQTLKSSPRAVGTACGANPIPLLIPCHRVVRADGGLGGYSGGEGVETKAFLLRLEGLDI